MKANRWYAYKSQSSQRVVDLHPVLVEILRGMKGRATGEFVVESRVRPRTSRSGQHYRCARVERRLIRWLRERGVEDQKPIHTLRKEFATRLMSQGAATAEVQQILGHADIATTASTYLGVRKRLYPEYGVRAG